MYLSSCSNIITNSSTTVYSSVVSIEPLKRFINNLLKTLGVETKFSDIFTVTEPLSSSGLDNFYNGLNFKKMPLLVEALKSKHHLNPEQFIGKKWEEQYKILKEIILDKNKQLIAKYKEEYISADYDNFRSDLSNTILLHIKPKYKTKGVDTDPTNLTDLILSMIDAWAVTDN